MNKVPEHSLTKTQLDEASNWYTRLKSEHLSDQDRSAFSKWLNGNECHQQAYAKIETLWGDLSTVSKLSFEEESKHKTGSHITQAASNQNKPHESSSKMIHSKWALFAIPAACLLAISFWLNIFSQNFQTQAGEQSTVHLDDGSTVYLNTDSSFSAVINEKHRLITLYHGEAYFDVAHDPARPFIVKAGEVSVKAIGTTFNVYYQDDKSNETLVTVIEGKVRVSSAERKKQNNRSGQLLKASQQSHIKNNSVNPIKSVNPKLFTSWKDQQLIYDDVSFAEVINDINRYTKDEIKITDEQLKLLPVSAAFKIQDQKAILKALEDMFHLTAVRISKSEIILNKLRS